MSELSYKQPLKPESSIPEFELKNLGPALESDWWNKTEYLIFEGILPPPVLNTPFRQNYFSLFFLESGHIDGSINMISYKLSKNDLQVINPHHVVHVKSISPHTRGKLVAFEKSLLAGEHFNLAERVSVFSSRPPVISLKQSEGKLISGLIDEMKLKLMDSQRPHRKEVAISMISALLYEIDAIYELNYGTFEKKQSVKEVAGNQFLNLVSIHFAKERSVKFYAEQVGISPGYLSELTKEITGKTPSDIIDEKVLIEAKVMLKNTNHTVKQIADILNFPDQFSFSKYFKKTVKISPLNYRKQND